MHCYFQHPLGMKNQTGNRGINESTGFYRLRTFAALEEECDHPRELLNAIMTVAVT
jgi:hypothetical protein